MSLSTACSRVAALAAALCLGGVAVAAPAPTVLPPLADVEACTLIEGMPSPGHPLRTARTWAATFKQLSAARTPKDYEAVQRRLRRAIDPLLARGTRVFHAKPFKRALAERFLTRHVLRANAALEVGEDRFELRLELAASLSFAACRAGNPDAAIALSRQASGPDKAALRAFGALLLLEAGREPEAMAIRPSLNEETFLGAWVLAEMAATTDGAERIRLHAMAKRRISNSDQATALAAQRRRYNLGH